MSTIDFITTLFCRVNDCMGGVVKHAQALLYPSEADTGFHGRTGDPANLNVRKRGTWNTRMMMVSTGCIWNGSFIYRRAQFVTSTIG